MNDLANSTLSAIERATAKLGPLNSLLDKLVEKVAPQTTANAACAGSRCATLYCTSNRCASNHNRFEGYYYWSTAPRGCEQGIYTCKQYVCAC